MSRSVRTLALAAGVSFSVLAAVSAQTPTFTADPFWPKPLPNNQILGSVTGIALDAKGNLWVVHRGQDSLNPRTESSLTANPPGAELCCRSAPQVLQFAPDGTLLKSWGGPGEGYDWPVSPGGIAVDNDGNVWITAAGPPPPATAGRSDEPGRGGAGGGRAGGGAAGGGRGQGGARGGTPAPPRPQDAHVLKFSADGKFLLQIGKPGELGDSHSKTNLNRPAGVDVAGGEVFVADGIVNRRVVVFDAKTGAYKRHWGAYGAAPDDTALPPYDPAAPAAKQFRTVTCVSVARDGLVYVCDRQNDRLQVFKVDGTYVREVVIAKDTRGNGSVWDVAFSPDAQQRYLYVADGQNQRVVILERSSLKELGAFGKGGRPAGHFYAVGALAVDAAGNIYTGENFEGKRVQRFVRK